MKNHFHDSSLQKAHETNLSRVNFFFLLDLHGALFFFLQTDSRCNARVGVWDAGRIHDAARSIRHDAQLGGVRCRPQYCTVRPLVGIWLIIVGRTRRVVVLTAWVWRRVGHVVGWQLASLTRFLRIGICWGEAMTWEIECWSLFRLTAWLRVVVALEVVFAGVLVVGLRQRLPLVLHSPVLEPNFDLWQGKER